MTRLKAENELLLARASKDRHALSIGRAILRAANKLPPGYLMLKLPDIAALDSIVLQDSHEGDDLGSEINAAVDKAIAVAQEQERQA